MDRIFINGMTVSAVIGTLPHEREKAQNIKIDLALECDMRKAGTTDDLRDAVDYSAVEKLVHDTVSASSFFLLEALAQRIADDCFSFDGVSGVTVRIEKPGGAAFSRSVAVEISRQKK